MIDRISGELQSEPNCWQMRMSSTRATPKFGFDPEGSNRLFCVFFLILFIQMKCFEWKQKSRWNVFKVFRRPSPLPSASAPKNEIQWNRRSRSDGALNKIACQLEFFQSFLKSDGGEDDEWDIKFHSSIFTDCEYAPVRHSVTRRHSAKGKSCKQKIGINFGRWHVNEEHPLDANILYALFLVFFFSDSKWFSFSLAHSPFLFFCSPSLAFRSRQVKRMEWEKDLTKEKKKWGKIEIDLAYKQRKHISMKL